MAPRTRIVKIGALLLSQFGLLAALNFQLFWMATAYKMMEIKRNLSLAAYPSARKTYLHRSKEKISSKLAKFMASLTASYRLTLSGCIQVDVLILHLSFEICETTNKILRLLHSTEIASPSDVAAAILFPGKQYHCECPITFQPGLKYEIF